MDPNTALFNLLECLADKEPDREDTIAYLDALLYWIRRGGAFPRVQGPAPHRDGGWAFKVWRHS